jgi:hypothetical protein
MIQNYYRCKGNKSSGIFLAVFEKNVFLQHYCKFKTLKTMKINKKIVVLLIGLTVCCANVFAQENTPTQQTEAEPFKVYCEIISYYTSFFSNKLTVEIDFGQQSNFFKTDREIVDDNGEAIKFNSIIDALNFMAERGWVLVEEYYDMRFNENSDRKQHWVLCKTVTDKSQVTEGFRTLRMNN